MSAWEEETRENLKADAGRCATAIRLQLLILMEALENTDEHQAVIRTALKESTSDLVPATELVKQVKAMLEQTYILKIYASLVHGNTLNLDHALTQLEALEKEAENE